MLGKKNSRIQHCLEEKNLSQVKRQRHFPGSKQNTVANRKAECLIYNLPEVKISAEYLPKTSDEFYKRATLLGRYLLNFFLMSENGWMDGWMEQMAKIEPWIDNEDNKKTGINRIAEEKFY
ncbi:hypothetical protein DUI87_18635 [Hirundo rustica rustica]|uniref:Uncharacterized protein n=1 Tax=Hirundo rustica rustica TaxID=333673 RepID=A0A3M0JWQ4_HIRRU|nr:hypothetical protein DUI87_18635 [Hirundo rustica rustica]